MTDTDRLARAVFTVLVLASFAAFFVTQRLKHTPTVVQRFMLTPYFSPTPTGRHKQERISFRIKEDDAVTVTIIDSAGEDVATLAHDRPLARYTQLSLSWNGRRGANGGRGPRRSGPLAGTSGSPTGPPAPAGEYRVRVSLRRQRRSVLSSRSFTLVLKSRRPA